MKKNDVVYTAALVFGLPAAIFFLTLAFYVR